MTRVLIADDQAAVRQGMRALLEHEPDLEVVGEAENGRIAVALANRRHADIVVMDVRMPEVDGLEATRQLVAAGGPDVLVVTTYDLDEYVFGALRAGAAGFLLKETVPEELVRAIRLIAAGQGLIAPTVTRRLIAEFARVAPRTEPDEELERLSRREREVLALMARGLSNAQIATTLNIEESTVKSHVTSLLAKLGLRSRVQAVILAFEQGLAPGSRAR